MLQKFFDSLHSLLCKKQGLIFLTYNSQDDALAVVQLLESQFGLLLEDTDFSGSKSYVLLTIPGEPWWEQVPTHLNGIVAVIIKNTSIQENWFYIREHYVRRLGTVSAAGISFLQKQELPYA